MKIKFILIKLYFIKNERKKDKVVKYIMFNFFDIFC